MRSLRSVGMSLTRQFAVLSLLVVLLITAALCLVIARHLRAHLLEREWSTTADFIRTEALQRLTADDFSAAPSATAAERFRRFYRETVMMPEIVRVKIYDSAMRVVWSDEPRLIGQVFVDNSQLTRALSGRTTVNLEVVGEKGENVYERGDPRLVEVYVPIVFPEGPRVVGVVEAYKEPAQVFASIWNGQVKVAATAAAGGALLYLCLFWIVRRAGRRIDAQHQALEQRSREVTEANQELRAVQTKLVEAERMAAIGEVVAAVAHGIRNPLANIRASAQVGLLDGPGERQSSVTTRSLVNVVTEADRLRDRLDEMMRFVRPADRQSRSFDVTEVLRSALNLMEAKIKDARITVDGHLEPALPLTVGDPMLIEQVFVNLLANAVEACPDGGVISLTTETCRGEDGALRIRAEVGDTGPGIPPDNVSLIFQMFYTTKAQGTGLGLATAKKFVEAHGGAIAVRSRPGAGAIFVVTLPVRGPA